MAAVRSEPAKRGPAMTRRSFCVACLFPALLALAAPPAQPQPRAGHPVFKNPLGLAVDQEARCAYVALQGAGAVAVVDLRAGKVLHEIPVGKAPFDLALSDRTIFVACERDDALVRVDLDKLAVTGRWGTGQAPRAVAVL